MAAEKVAEQIEEVAEVTRRIDVKSVGFLFGGLGVGIAVGFYFGYRYNKEKLRMEAFEHTEAEIESVREFYRQKETARMEKPAVAEIIEERGYSTAVKIEELEARPLKAPVPLQTPVTRVPAHFHTKDQVPKRHVDQEKDKNEGWDYDVELPTRTETEPFIIHQDEFALNESEYGQVTLTYYANDYVLVDENEEKIEDPESIVGVGNLERFGHGTDDYHVLYVRNVRLQLEYEICLLVASYEENVLGLQNDTGE